MAVNAVRTAAEIADGNFVVNVPDFHSNLDALSALLSPMNLCYELMDSPEDLEECLNKLNSDFARIYNTFYEAGNMKNTGTITWLPLYCEGKMTAIQCDFSCMMSPDQARQFVILSIEKELESVDRAVYHYDGKMALGHFDDVMAVKRLDCIQWTPGAGQKRTIYWMDLLKKVQAGGKSVWLRDWTAEEILADTELDPALTAFTLDLKSEREAEEFMEKLERKYR
jgi:5-methyltetrahydrofolate--homocysteine methyltransferase